MGDMQFNGTPEEWDALVKKNRQTTVKLYTEEQVKEAIELAREKYPKDIILTTKGVLSQFTPIELPSDEEIREKASGHSDWHCDQSSFIYGAKYVINKIQGGNK
jgi:hypothetical protein